MAGGDSRDTAPACRILRFASDDCNRFPAPRVFRAALRGLQQRDRADKLRGRTLTCVSVATLLGWAEGRQEGRRGTFCELRVANREIAAKFAIDEAGVRRNLKRIRRELLEGQNNPHAREAIASPATSHEMPLER